MALEAPVLDDRTFRDIFDEAKALIPRYAPEWTNHNDHDPGITLLQLFAWMTDILLYRVNRVPDRNYIKFLQLLGIELQPGQPASVELTYTLSRDDLDTVLIPQGSLVAAAEPDEQGENIVFETEEALIALGAKLAAVQVYDGVGYSVQTAANDALEQTLYPFGVYAREGSALMLGFASPLPFTAQQVNLAVTVQEATEITSAACNLQLESLPLAAVLVWEYWNGKGWLPLSVDKDETQALLRSGHIYLQGPGKKAVKAALGNAPDALYWLRCRLERSFYETAPRLVTVRTNTVRATQALTTRDEVLGGSNGRPNQRFFLANTPVVPLASTQQVIGAGGKRITLRSIRLEVSERPIVDEDRGFQVWEEVDDFLASGEDDPHFTLNRTTGEIQFGDGKRGRIPVANPTNPTGNIVARLYRYGGGERGNVGAGKLTNPQTFVANLDSVTNLFPAGGGSDEETVEEAKQRAPSVLKSRDRAVTTEDFEYFARATPGVHVRRALALPLAHPMIEGAQIPGVVTVVVVPESDDPRPMPNQRTLTAVCEYLNKRRLLTTEVFVTPPTYRKVRVETEIVAQPQADLAAVKRGVETALTTFFHPLRGGGGQGWAFGRTIFFSHVVQTILSVPGVDRIRDNQLVIFLDDVAQPFCRDVPLNEGELLYSDGHDLEVIYER